MPVITSTRLITHGSHFRAYSLRDEAKLLSPFLGVDHAWMSGPTFPAHSHTGLSAVSYPFLDSATGIDNRDSLGTHNLIKPGGLHWTAAGSGIVHEEVPAEPGKTVHSLQIFVDLPVDKKNMAPQPFILEAESVPSVNVPGARIRVPVGSYGDITSPLSAPTAVTLLDITLDQGATVEVPVTGGHNAFVMPIFGAVSVNEQTFRPDDHKLPVFPATATQQVIALTAHDNSAKVMFFSGKPLNA
ncbi:pirin family protein [Photobacterium sp. TY1-4]|uniref:pirin family protein n=1 Tax=Photobacterium sp. TY1-4 TaxID=2899122 RepID=UPI0021C000F3|nr:pirin family protein [Photobacterium sp. TY1-4]UXI04491.1 pirin family protein [Photobacterium sp. TY1-4]